MDVNFASEIAVGVHEAAELNEGAHDSDVDLADARRAKDTGEHGDGLFGEGVGCCPTEMAARGFGI